MNKKLFYGLAVIAIAALAAVNLNVSNSQTAKLSDLSLANVEALAQSEVQSSGCCPQGGFCIVTVNGVIVYSAVGECPCSGG